MQVVDILGHQRQKTAPRREPLLEPRQREMRGVRLGPDEVAPPRVVEGEHRLRVAREGLRRRELIGSNFAQIPSPVLSRKVPSPLSAETPAPVRTKTCWDMGPFLTSSEFDDNRNDLSAAGPQCVGSRLRPQPPGAAAFLWRGFPGDSRLSHDCLIRRERISGRRARRCWDRRTCKGQAQAGAALSWGARLDRPAPKPVDCNDLPRRDSCGIVPCRASRLRAGRPGLHPSFDERARFLLRAGRGLTAGPRAHAQPTSGPRRYLHKGLKRPIAVARRILDLGADLAERLAFPAISRGARCQIGSPGTRAGSKFAA